MVVVCGRLHAPCNGISARSAIPRHLNNGSLNTALEDLVAITVLQRFCAYSFDGLAFLASNGVAVEEFPVRAITLAHAGKFIIWP